MAFFPDYTPPPQTYAPFPDPKLPVVEASVDAVPPIVVPDYTPPPQHFPLPGA